MKASKQLKKTWWVSHQCQIINKALICPQAKFNPVAASQTFQHHK